MDDTYEGEAGCNQCTVTISRITGGLMHDTIFQLLTSDSVLQRIEQLCAPVLFASPIEFLLPPPGLYVREQAPDLRR